MAAIPRRVGQVVRRYPEAQIAASYSIGSVEIHQGHLSAFFELYLHELLLCAGLSVTVHPDMPYSTRR